LDLAQDDNSFNFAVKAGRVLAQDDNSFNFDVKASASSLRMTPNKNEHFKD